MTLEEMIKERDRLDEEIKRVKRDKCAQAYKSLTKALKCYRKELEEPIRIQDYHGCEYELRWNELGLYLY